MAKILLIETSTALCSAALSVDGKVVASRQSGLDRSHASLTAVYCDEVLREAGLKPAQLDAVCISDGPGSYTGLRVGLSTAKGLCFGAGLKLLSVSSLDVLAMMYLGRVQGDGSQSTARKIIPMIDARRMEVYTAEYEAVAQADSNLCGIRRTSGIEAKVIEEGAYAGIASQSVFIGDGALKCKEAIGAGEFIEAYPEASAMASLAEHEFAAGNFRDVAYFEPFYLKEFVATTSKKKMW